VKLKSLVLGGGFAVFGLLETSVMAADWCKGVNNGEISNDSQHCRGENHMYAKNKSCICPNPNNSRDPNQELTRKCFQKAADLAYIYTCEKP